MKKNKFAYGLATVLQLFAVVSVMPASFWYVYNGEVPKELLK